MATLENPQITAKRNIIVVGRSGAGKSTVANHILGANASRPRSRQPFKVIASPEGGTENPEIQTSEFYYEEVRYDFTVIDTVGLFDNKYLSNEEVMRKTKNAIKRYVNCVHLIVFVIKESRFTQEEKIAFNIVHEHFSKDIDPISFLVITGCEGRNKDNIVAEYRRNAQTCEILSHMEKGVIAVGFPNLAELEEGLKKYYESSVKRDALELRKVAVESKEMYLKDELYCDDSSDSQADSRADSKSSSCVIL